MSATTSAGEADGEDSAESGEEVEADGDSMSMVLHVEYCYYPFFDLIFNCRPLRSSTRSPSRPRPYSLGGAPGKTQARRRPAPGRLSRPEGVRGRTRPPPRATRAPRREEQVGLMVREGQEHLLEELADRVPEAAAKMTRYVM